MSDMPVDPVTSAEGGELGHAPSGEVRQDQPFAPPPPVAGAVDARPTPSEPPPAQVPPAPTTHVARVMRVTAEQVFVDVSGRQGTVPMIEFVGQPLPKEGDEFSVIIESEDAATGLLALSKRQAEEQTFWDSVKPGDILEGVVTGMNKGGLDIDIGGARAFLPASQVDTHRMRDISTLIGEHVRCVVSQVDRTTRDLIVSRRKLIDRDRKTKRAEMLRTLEEGELRVGTVSNITEYGAFVDLGGVDGLLHVTDMSWGRVKNPTEIVQMGQELQVRVLKVDRQAGKVSLGLKQIAPDPWEGAALKYAEGSRIRAAVARLADFGAFLELEPGIDALLPLSEMSWSRRIGSVSERVKIGDELEVVILKVDPARKRISVGLKQTEENPWASVETRFPVDAMVRGKVARVMEYGAFVELAPGLEGLVHISELSSQRVRQVGDVLQEGQEIEVRVLKVDLQAQRISLSMKPKIEMSARAESPASKKPARKRPLRGGLSSHFDW